MPAILSPASAPHATALTCPGVQVALGILLEGYEYARDLGSSPWEFAVDLALLLAGGCTPNTLRWLVRRGYVEQGLTCMETANPQAGAHRGGAFSERNCFVLTELGVSIAQADMLPAARAALREPNGSEQGEGYADIPVWDPSSGELRFLGNLIRRFRNAASNQRAVLDSFEGHGWPVRLRDPLPRVDGRHVNVKQRLHDTVKNLNRTHVVRCLHFYVTDAGHAVGWQRSA